MGQGDPGVFDLNVRDRHVRRRIFRNNGNRSCVDGLLLILVAVLREAFDPDKHKAGLYFARVEGKSGYWHIRLAVDPNRNEIVNERTERCHRIVLIGSNIITYF